MATLVKEYRNVHIHKVPLEAHIRLKVLRWQEGNCPACEVKITNFWFSSENKWCKTCETYWTLQVVGGGADKIVVAHRATVADYNKEYRRRHKDTEMGV